MLRPVAPNETAEPLAVNHTASPLWDLREPQSKLLLWRGRAWSIPTAKAIAVEQAAYADHALFPLSLEARAAAIRGSLALRAKEPQP